MSWGHEPNKKGEQNMGTTANFCKLRSTGVPKTGEWNINYKDALAKAKKDGKFIVTCWSNGDICGFCVSAEECMMQQVFKDWIKGQCAYFVFQHSKDADKGDVLHDWIFTKGKVKRYPGYRVTKYDASGKIVFDKAVDGNTLRGNKAKATGAKEMIKNLEAMFSAPGKTEPAPAKKDEYKVRLNEKLTVKKINAVLDAIDRNGGYCPCQPGRTADTKCHCKDFVEVKKIGEPCICYCGIYVKQPKDAKK